MTLGGGGAVAVAVAVAGLTKRFFNQIQKDFLINVWGIILHSRMMCRMMRTYHPIILQARRGINVLPESPHDLSISSLNLIKSENFDDFRQKTKAIPETFTKSHEHSKRCSAICSRTTG